jgi:hypothetical protein
MGLENFLSLKYMQMNLNKQKKSGNKEKSKVYFLQLKHVCYTYIKDQIFPKVVMKF